MGLNAVRIPFGYWIVTGPTHGDPYEGPALELLDRAVQWAKDFGLEVLLDLHGCPGGESGSAPCGRKNRGWTWKSWRIPETLHALEVVARRYCDQPHVTGLAVCNEPSRLIPGEVLANYYDKAVSLIRACGMSAERVRELPHRQRVTSFAGRAKKFRGSRRSGSAGRMGRVRWHRLAQALLALALLHRLPPANLRSLADQLSDWRLQGEMGRAMAADAEMARERSRTPPKEGERDDPPSKRPRNGKGEPSPEEQEEMARMEAEWQQQEIARKRAAAEAAAKRLMSSKRHEPPLYRDSDGDQAHEFWEETPNRRGTLKVMTDGISEGLALAETLRDMNVVMFLTAGGLRNWIFLTGRLQSMSCRVVQPFHPGSLQRGRALADAAPVKSFRKAEPSACGRGKSQSGSLGDGMTGMRSAPGRPREVPQELGATVSLQPQEPWDDLFRPRPRAKDWYQKFPEEKARTEASEEPEWHPKLPWQPRQREWAGSEPRKWRQEKWREQEKWKDQKWTTRDRDRDDRGAGDWRNDWSSWSKTVRVGEDGLLVIILREMGIEDDELQSFCAWLPQGLEHIRRSHSNLFVTRGNIILAKELDLSKNRITDQGLKVLLTTLKENRVVLGVCRLYHNRLGKHSASMLAMWIRTAPWALFELHLSHNRIPTEGAIEIVQAVANTDKYPPDRPNSKGMHIPLWLRMEHNEIEESFAIEAERIMRQARPHVRGALICWLTPKQSERSCRSDFCGLSNKYHCPVIHMPYLPRQKAWDAMHSTTEKERQRKVRETWWQAGDGEKKQVKEWQVKTDREAKVAAKPTAGSPEATDTSPEADQEPVQASESTGEVEEATAAEEPEGETAEHSAEATDASPEAEQEPVQVSESTGEVEEATPAEEPEGETAEHSAEATDASPEVEQEPAQVSESTGEARDALAQEDQAPAHAAESAEEATDVSQADQSPQPAESTEVSEAFLAAEPVDEPADHPAEAIDASPAVDQAAQLGGTTAEVPEAFLAAEPVDEPANHPAEAIDASPEVDQAAQLGGSTAEVSEAFLLAEPVDEPADHPAEAIDASPEVNQQLGGSTAEVSEAFLAAEPVDEPAKHPAEAIDASPEVNQQLGGSTAEVAEAAEPATKNFA
ncbi:unnamed protein product [Effrenium voratum]|nr:unnamed protein product [Effrenium voratum]